MQNILSVKIAGIFRILRIWDMIGLGYRMAGLGQTQLSYEAYCLKA